MTIALPELAAITAFLQARDSQTSSRNIEAWCEARDVESADVLFYAASMTRSCLATISASGEEPDADQVEAAIGAAIVTALQTGIDAERRRRDESELPV